MSGHGEGVKRPSDYEFRARLRDKVVVPPLVVVQQGHPCPVGQKRLSRELQTR